MAGSLEPIVAQIRDRMDIVELIGRYISLQKSGSTYKASCPFHQEKTPSFHVNPQKQYFYCFGCGAKGDIFSFLMQYENKRFPEVVEQLAQELGISIDISEEEREAYTKEEANKELLGQLNQLAKLFFIEQLQTPEGKEARDYLKQRGVSDESIKKFGLGYAPDSWDRLTHYLQDKGFELEKISEAGLIRKADKADRYYDRFRHRLMFPIWRTDKRIVGFGGRALKEGEPAKYLNSPETPIFHKSSLLYGSNFAHEAIRKSQRAILVEGYLDVIAMHQFGFNEAVAALGTSFSLDHLKELHRYTKKIVLLFDADKAGYKAAERALRLIIPAGMSAELLLLPEGEDPDSFLHQQGRQAFADYLETHTQPAFEAWIAHLLEDTQKDPIKIREISESVLSLLREIKDPILQDLYLRQSAELLGIEESTLRRQFISVVSSSTFSLVPQKKKETFVQDVATAQIAGRPTSTPESLLEDKAVFELLKILVDHVDDTSIYDTLMEMKFHELFADSFWQRLWLEVLEDVEEAATPAMLIDSLLDAVGFFPNVKQSLATQLIRNPKIDLKIATKMLRELQHTLKELKMLRQIRHLGIALSEAEKAGEKEEADRLFREKIHLQQQLSRHSQSQLT